MKRIIAAAGLLCLAAAVALCGGQDERIGFEKAAKEIIVSHKTVLQTLRAKHQAVISPGEAIRLATISALYDGILDEKPQRLLGRLVNLSVQPERWITSYGRIHPGASTTWRTDHQHPGVKVSPQLIVLTNEQDDYMEWCHEALISDLTPFIASVRLFAPGGVNVGLRNKGTSSLLVGIPARAWCDLVIKRDSPLDEVVFLLNGREIAVRGRTSVADRLTFEFDRANSVYISRLEFSIWQQPEGRQF